MSVAASNRQSLKDHVYRVIYINQIPVFSLDLVEADALVECGIDIGCKGLTLLDILVELVREGKLVAYHENRGYRAYDDLVFVSRRAWDRDLAMLSGSMRNDINRGLEWFDDDYLSGLKMSMFPSSQVYHSVIPQTYSVVPELQR